MRATIDAFFAFAEREPLAWRLLFPDRPPVDPEAADDHRRLRSEATRMLAAMLAADAHRAGIDPSSAVGQAIFALQQAALRDGVRWWRAHPDVTRDELVEAAMIVLWSGLGSMQADV
jgi:hypothetical protein